jgi:hypothetical protein
MFKFYALSVGDVAAGLKAVGHKIFVCIQMENLNQTQLLQIVVDQFAALS